MHISMVFSASQERGRLIAWRLSVISPASAFRTYYIEYSIVYDSAMAQYCSLPIRISVIYGTQVVKYSTALRFTNYVHRSFARRMSLDARTHFRDRQVVPWMLRSGNRTEDLTDSIEDLPQNRFMYSYDVIGKNIMRDRLTVRHHTVVLHERQRSSRTLGRFCRFEHWAVTDVKVVL